jgi:hypothetical protein
MAVEHLISHGHEHIGLVMGSAPDGNCSPAPIGPPPSSSAPTNRQWVCSVPSTKPACGCRRTSRCSPSTAHPNPKTPGPGSAQSPNPSRTWRRPPWRRFWPPGPEGKRRLKFSPPSWYCAHPAAATDACTAFPAALKGGHRWGKTSSVLVAVARSSPPAVLRRPSVNITREPVFTTDPSASRAPFWSVMGRRYLTARSMEV